MLPTVLQIKRHNTLFTTYTILCSIAYSSTSTSQTRAIPSGKTIFDRVSTPGIDRSHQSFHIKVVHKVEQREFFKKVLHPSNKISKKTIYQKVHL